MSDGNVDRFRNDVEEGVEQNIGKAKLWIQCTWVI